MHRSKSNKKKSNKDALTKAKTSKAVTTPQTEQKKHAYSIEKEQVNEVKKLSTFTPDSLLSNRFQVLSFQQVKRLQKIIDMNLSIKSYQDSSFPTINVTIRELLGDIRGQLQDQRIIIKDIRLNMDVASDILGSEFTSEFKVVDIIFTLSFDDIATQQQIKNTLFKILIDKLRISINNGNETFQNHNINEKVIIENYVRTMARVNNISDPCGDSWSFISFGMQDADGQTVEMKFIDRKKRQYEFTVDSFQIILDTLLSFNKVSKCSSINRSLYPTVVSECVSGSFQEALRHLIERKIFTKQPEEISGGGLLKYCKLLTEGYKQDPSLDIKSIEKYMCSRFFIDYPEICDQKKKIERNLNIFFYANYEKQTIYLKILYKVVSKSTVCLMFHEKRATLQLLKDLLKKSTLNIELKQSIVRFDEFGDINWNLDQIFYGTLYFPQQVYVVSSQHGKLSNDSTAKPELIYNDNVDDLMEFIHEPSENFQVDNTTKVY